jgi:nucleoside 2-deoxyribosyltransferase
MKIYFAAPLFSEGEKQFNKELTDQLEKMGFEVFLPQRDGAEKDKSPYDTMSKEERRQALFSLDRDKILEADIFLFILDGRVPDEGACVELGMAYAHKYLTPEGKRLIGLQTDSRAAFLGAKLNPMISVPLEAIASTREELKEILTWRT